MTNEMEEQVLTFLAEAEVNGYRQFRNHLRATDPGHVGFVQKRILGGVDTLFFIDLTAYDFTDFMPGCTPPDLRITSTVRFADGEDTVEVNRPFRGFNQVETFYRALYDAMGFEPCEVAEPEMT